MVPPACPGAERHFRVVTAQSLKSSPVTSPQSSSFTSLNVTHFVRYTTVCTEEGPHQAQLYLQGLWSRRLLVRWRCVKDMALDGLLLLAPGPVPWRPGALEHNKHRSLHSMDNHRLDLANRHTACDGTSNLSSVANLCVQPVKRTTLPKCSAAVKNRGSGRRAEDRAALVQQLGRPQADRLRGQSYVVHQDADVASILHDHSTGGCPGTQHSPPDAGKIEHVPPHPQMEQALREKCISGESPSLYRFQGTLEGSAIGTTQWQGVVSRSCLGRL